MTDNSFAKPLLRELKRMKDRPVYFMAPILVMSFCYLFFLTFLKEGLPNELPIGVTDLDHSVFSRALIRNIDATPQNRVVSHYANFTEARRDMQRGQIYAFVYIQSGMEEDLLAGRQPGLTMYVNNAYLIAGSLTLKNLTLMGELNGAYIRMKQLDARGVTGEEEIMATVQPVAVDTHLIANPWANYGIYLINLLLPGVLQLLIIMFTVFTIGIELKQHTGTDWLQSAGGSIASALAGKLFPYSLLFSFLGIAGNFILYKHMHFPMNGSLLTLCLATLLFVFAHQAIGIFIIGLFPILQDGISLGAFYGLLGFTFAGFTFPIEGMPAGAQIFAEFFPIRHYFRIYVNEALNGGGIHHSLLSMAFLASFILLPLPLLFRLKKSIRLRFQKKDESQSVQNA